MKCYVYIWSQLYTDNYSMLIGYSMSVWTKRTHIILNLNVIKSTQIDPSYDDQTTTLAYISDNLSHVSRLIYSLILAKIFFTVNTCCVGINVPIH